VIFDPEGEYFWPDDKGRPGLADVPKLKDKLVVFTPRRGPSPFYQSFVAGDVRHESVKRIASAVGEGAMAMQFVHQHLASL
jgi:thioredoxin reductase